MDWSSWRRRLYHQQMTCELIEYIFDLMFSLHLMSQLPSKYCDIAKNWLMFPSRVTELQWLHLLVMTTIIPLKDLHWKMCVKKSWCFLRTKPIPSNWTSTIWDLMTLTQPSSKSVEICGCSAWISIERVWVRGMRILVETTYFAFRVWPFKFYL